MRSERVHCRGCYREVVDDLRDRAPTGERPGSLDVERDDYRIAGLDLRARGAPEPTPSAVSHHLSIRPYHVDAPLVGTPSEPAAPVEVVVAGEARFEQVRGRVLHLAENRDFLAEGRNEKLVAVAEEHVPLRDAGYDLIQADDEPAGRCGIAELGEQRLSDRHRIVGQRIRKRQRGEIRLDSAGEGLQLRALALLQLDPGEHATLWEGLWRQSAGPPQHRRERLALADLVSAGEQHFSAQRDARL